MRQWKRLSLAAFALLGCLSAGEAMAACNLTPTNGTETRTINGRTYTINVPAGLAGPQVPLLVSMHGAWGSSSVHESMVGWTPFAAQKKFIVAYPQGANNGYWDLSEGSPEVGYLRSVVADIAARYCIDPGRIYVDGHSRGAVMAQRAACEAGDLFASATAYSGPSPAYEGHACHPGRPIAVGLFGGDYFDPIMLSHYDEQARDFWVANATCHPVPARSSDANGYTDLYTGCLDGVQVAYRILTAQSHDFPMGTKGDDLRNKMWSFLLANPKPLVSSAPQSSQPGVTCNYFNPLTWVACASSYMGGGLGGSSGRSGCDYTNPPTWMSCGSGSGGSCNYTDPSTWMSCGGGYGGTGGSGGWGW